MIDIPSLRRDFKTRYVCEPFVVAAPGRVNLIGEHTDYNKGFVLPFAIDKCVYIACSRRDDGLVKAYTRTMNESVEFDLEDPPQSIPTGWQLYVKGMVNVLRRKGLQIPGANLLIDSEIPLGAGLSSSAALEVGLGFALAHMSGSSIAPEEIALAGQTVEHEFAGVKSGIMDQFASALSRVKHLLLIDCQSQRTEHVPIGLGNLIFAVCDSMVKHKLADTAYNQRRSECESGVKIMRGALPHASLRDVSIAEFTQVEDQLPETVRRRCRHVIFENVRTLAAVAAVRNRDFLELGRLMCQSHESLRDDYQVSCPELDKLVGSANDCPGVLGSRMTGGGFGGSTITLLEASAFEVFQNRIKRDYFSEFGISPTIFQVGPSAGARAIDT